MPRLSRTDSDEEEHNFFNVDKFKKVLASQARPKSAGLLGRFVGRMARGIESVQGFLAALLGLPILFGGVFIVLVGALYGPWAFLGVAGCVLGLLAFYVNRKVGKSMQFGDYSLLRRTLGQLVAFLIVMALLYALIVIPGFLRRV